jgi:hypothetical protein
MKQHAEEAAQPAGMGMIVVAMRVILIVVTVIVVRVRGLSMIAIIVIIVHVVAVIVGCSRSGPSRLIGLDMRMVVIVVGMRVAV